MAQIDDLTTKIAAVQQAATDAAKRAADDHAAQQTEIDALKAQVASLQPPDLTAPLASLDGVAQTLAGIDPAVAPAA